MTTTDARSVEGFAERIFAATLGSMELQAMYLGEKLGWYRALAEQGPLNARELAAGTGCDARYAREWLEQQAVIGYLDVVSPGEPEDPAERRFSLPPEHAEVLTDPDSAAYLSPLSWMMAAFAGNLPALLEAYRTGGGVSWAQFGTDARQAQAALNRPMFLHQLSQELLPAVPGLDDALRAGARVADIGCGEGWSSIGLALGYPDVTVDGFDLDEPSVEAANRHAAEAGVADRVRVHLADASQVAGTGGSYDLVLAVECVHDLSDPVSVLATMRGLVKPGGTVLVVDERTAETFAAPGDMLEQLFYGYSVLCCLPDGRSHPDSAATGTVMRPGTLKEYAWAAGFAGVEVLDVEHELFRFYRLR